MFNAFQKLKSMIGNPEIELYFGDLNAVEAKDFKVVYAGASATNRPVNANGYCVTMAYNPNRSNKKQIYYVQSNSNLVFERTCNSGVWTEWISKQQTITTGTEYETGRIIDNKKEYGLRKNLGALPNSTNTTYNTGLSSAYKITKYQLFAKNRTNNQLLTVPFISLNNSQYISAYCDDANTISAMNNFNSSSYDLIIEINYTKS